MPITKQEVLKKLEDDIQSLYPEIDKKLITWDGVERMTFILPRHLSNQELNRVCEDYQSWEVEQFYESGDYREQAYYYLSFS